MEYRKTKPQKKDNLKHQNSEIDPRKNSLVKVDFERFAHFLEDSDLSEEQKLECLQAYWIITLELVSLKLGVHPLNQAENPCGKTQNNPPHPALSACDRLYLNPQTLANTVEKIAKDSNAGQSDRRGI